ncbi:MAG: pyridoxal-phosphate dependent enzyme, partial [Planctomycetota bacterium]
ASGSSPITTAVKLETDVIRPVKPNTIAQSIAIGNPADGFYSVKTINVSGGWAEDVTDDELVEGIKLLARTEGIFTETAGGVTVAVTRKLIEQGKLPRNESIVISITGNGLKTQEAVINKLEIPKIINPSLAEFVALIEEKKAAAGR